MLTRDEHRGKNLAFDLSMTNDHSTTQVIADRSFFNMYRLQSSYTADICRILDINVVGSIVPLQTIDNG